MKTFVQIAIPFLLLSGAGCAQKPKPAEHPVDNLPVVLESKSVEMSNLYKRNKENLIESLYQELIKQSEELQALDASIKSLGESRKKALDSFKLFNEKNDAYYESAKLNVKNIQDSIFRKKVQALVDESLKQYNLKTLPHRQLDSLLAKKSAAVNDLYILLKVVTTLPSMHEYQQSRMPGTSDLDALNRQLDSLHIRLDTLTKQH